MGRGEICVRKHTHGKNEGAHETLAALKITP